MAYEADTLWGAGLLCESKVRPGYGTTGERRQEFADHGRFCRWDDRSDICFAPPTYVRFGSFADICSAQADVR
jgi:hypothetical protein